MKIKQLKYQVFYAAVAVVASFIALSSATYAWYSSNNKVSADGISISAQTEGRSFEITSVVDSSNQPVFVVGQTIDHTVFEATELLPTHPKFTTGTNSVTWEHAFSKEYDDAAVTAERAALTGATVEDHILKLDDKQYALHTTYYFRLNPEVSGEDTTITDLIARNVVVTGIKDYTKCVRLVVVGEDAAYEIAPAGASGEGINATESGVLISTIARDTNTYKVEVYAFFEGTDENCKSSFFEAEDINISLEFVGTVN